MNAFVDACVLTGVFSFGFATFVFLKGQGKRVAILWGLNCVAIGIYSIGQGKTVSAATVQEAVFWYTWFLYTGAIMIPVLFLHFMTIVLADDRGRLLWIGYGCASVLQCLNFSGHLARAVPFPPFRFYDFPQESYPLYVVYFFGFVAYTEWLLLVHLRRAAGQRKNQLTYLLWGTSIGFAGATTTFFPLWHIPIFPYGVYAVPVYILVISYAIVKHRLMDIHVVIRKTVIYSVVTAMLTLVYLSIVLALAWISREMFRLSSGLSYAAAAAAITLLFHPLRMKVQRFVDRHFFRESLDQVLLREATSGFVHEIKRPLANISLPAELSLIDIQDLKAGRRSPEDVLPKVEQRLEYILHQMADAGNRIEAIREFSAQNSSAFDKIHLSKIFAKSLEAEDGLIKAHRVLVHLELPADLPLILGNEKQLEIVFCNLIKNAAEALSLMPRGAARTLSIQASKDNGALSVTIKDSGPGIDPANHRHLFEPYFTTKGAHGTGMGLYLCRQIVQTHGGTIEVRSPEGHGAEFIIRLPQIS